MRCAEIMKTDIECIMPQTTAERAAQKMREKNVGFLPVCDDQKKVLGALTDRDIAVRLVAEGKPGSTPAEQIMTSDCVSCSPDDDVQRAQQLMAQQKKSRIMCVDENGTLRGIISLSDIAQHAGAGASDTLRQVSSREAKAAQPQPGM